MSLFNFIDRQGPIVSAAWLNAVDLIRNALGATSAGNITVNAPSSGTGLTVLGSMLVGAPTGGDKGVGTINATGLYVNGSPVSSSTGTSPGGTDIEIQYNNAGSFGGATMYYNKSNGSFSIGAPTSAVALTVSGTGAYNAINSNGALQVSDSTANYLTTISSSAANSYIDSSYTSGSTLNLRTANASGVVTQRVSINSSGNVTINAPSSGTTLALAGLASQYAWSATDGTSTSALYLNGASGSQIGTYSNHAFTLYSNNAARVAIAAAGNVTINAPTSGQALTVTAATGGLSNAGLIVNGSASTPISAVTFSATAMSIDCTRSNVFITTLTANVTTAPVYPNPQDGQTINWFILQDATGTRTMTWGAAVKWPGGTAGVLSTAANAVDLLVMTYRSATNFWYAILSKGFA